MILHLDLRQLGHLWHLIGADTERVGVEVTCRVPLGYTVGQITQLPALHWHAGSPVTDEDAVTTAFWPSPLVCIGRPEGLLGPFQPINAYAVRPPGTECPPIDVNDKESP